VGTISWRPEGDGGVRGNPAVRVLFVIPSVGSGGGAERSLVESVPQFLDHGIEVSIAQFFHRPHEDSSTLAQLGARIYDVEGHSLPCRAWSIRRIIHEEQPNIVHTTLFEADIAGRLAAWHVHRPSPHVLTSLVNTSYDDARESDPNVRQWKLRAVRMVDGWTARHLTGHFHAVTRSVKEHAVRHLRLPPDRITVVERGRDLARLGAPSPARRKQVRDALGLDTVAPVIVTAGRQEYQKGHVQLVRAFAQLASEFPDSVLLLAGREGRETTKINEVIARCTHRARMRLLGHRSDLPDILAAADIFAFPSVYEGFGGTVVEAMALALPVVTSDLPAVREVVEPGKSALTVPAGDAHALATALATLLEDSSLRQQFGTRGREIFLERFTIDRSCRSMIRLYRELATI
jgi:glycosyltransferase involved in cell wall biosynthesis